MRGALPVLAMVLVLAGCERPAPAPAPATPQAAPVVAEPVGVRMDYVLAGGKPFASLWIYGNRAVWEDRIPAMERSYALYDASDGRLLQVFPDSGRVVRVVAGAAVGADAGDGFEHGAPRQLAPGAPPANVRAISECHWVAERDADVALAQACIATIAPPGMSAADAAVFVAMLNECGRIGPADCPIVWPLTRTDLIDGVPMEVRDFDGGFHLIAQPVVADPAARARTTLQP